jgi:hypothetical protein
MGTAGERASGRERGGEAVPNGGDRMSVKLRDSTNTTGKGMTGEQARGTENGAAVSYGSCRERERERVLCRSCVSVV